MENITTLPRKIFKIINIILLFFIINSAFIIDYLKMPYLNLICIPIFILLNIFPSLTKKGYPSFRIRMCSNGCELLIYFIFTTAFSTIFNIITLFYMLPDYWFRWILCVLSCIIYESIIFWNGIISIYFTSLQLGIHQRVIGIICGWIPIVNIFYLLKIVKIVTKEVNFEIAKAKLNKSREYQKICATKYPILFIHGVFFRDSKYFNYWGRIPKELMANGATVYYGNHQSALSVEKSAKELAIRIKQIINETGCEKLNIIAHSKGGLDCRYAISKCNCAPYVASLTTINTPHRGCGFADYLLYKSPTSLKEKVANTYNTTLKKLGDNSPDFISAISNLTEEYCNDFNDKVHDVVGIHYHSVGSKLNCASNGKFPLSFSYPLVKYFDGANDGLVSENSFPWGEKFTFITVKGKRGVSHGDMIDLNRENIDGFDVREFYVQMVAELKNIGL